MNREAYKKKMFSKSTPSKQKLYVERLLAWEAELRTNKYNMKDYAERAIRILKTDIEDFWPGLLKQLEKSNGS